MELDVALELRNVFKSFGDGHECGKERWRDGGWTVDSGLWTVETDKTILKAFEPLHFGF